MFENGYSFWGEYRFLLLGSRLVEFFLRTETGAIITTEEGDSIITNV